MKPKLLFILAAIYTALGGLSYLISPATAVLGLDTGASATLLAEIRYTGSFFLGIAVLNWFARNAEASKARDAIFLGNTVGFGIAVITETLLALASGEVISWVFVVINLFFTVAFFVVGRTNMSASNS